MTASGLSRVLSYGALMVTSAAASLSKWFVFARILGSDDFSYFALLELIGAYGLYFGSLGLLEGASRTVPLLRGCGRERAARALATKATASLMVLSSAVASVFALGAWAVTSDHTLSVMLTLGGLYVIANNLFLIGTALLVSFDRPLAFAVAMLVKNGGTLVFGGLLGSVYGLFGVICAEIAVAASVAVWCLISGRTLKGMRFGRLRRLRGLFAVGLPLMANNLVQNLTRNIDRLVVGAALGILAFGQYTFAMVIAMAGGVALNILSQYITPRLCYVYGAKVDHDTIIRQLDTLVCGLLALAMLGALPFVWMIDRFGLLIFPEFSMGLALMPIIYIGAALQTAQLYQGILTAWAEGWRLTRQAVFVGTFALAACGLGLTIGAGAEYFAWVFVAHRLIAAILVRYAVNQVCLPSRMIR
jgi:O-antigen/teichoic acid export membrane protein